ncbi:MAG: hypothetical protein KDK34_10835, partial [Leptospiraceae bacterium]|nr:hypothetical protein [Leptospiraceae bacterium]
MGRLNGDRNKAVITGIGVVSPAGIGSEALWTALMEGRSCIKEIRQFDASSYPCRHAAEVSDLIESGLTRLERRMLSRGGKFACSALLEALHDARIERLEPYSTDVIIGAGHVDMNPVEDEVLSGRDILNFNPEQNAAGLLQMTISMPASFLALKSGARGHVETTSSACASSINAISSAAARIESGMCEIAITGGVDTPITRMTLNAFLKAGQLPVEYADHTRVMRPFDRDHSKSFLGEGSAILILESAEHALARGAKIYCEVIPGRQISENTNVLFSPDEVGESWNMMLDQLLARYEKVTCVNAHGPSDRKIDNLEARILKNLLGARAGRVPITSVKGITGGGMAGAASIQVAAGALMLKNRTITPIANYEFPENEFKGMNFIREPVAIDGGHMLVNARGFGGIL